MKKLFAVAALSAAFLAVTLSQAAEPAPAPAPAPAEPAPAAAPAAEADGKGPPKNLQVLPKDISRQDLTAIMKRFNKDLGVKCGFCHKGKDFASDDNEHKKIARQMMRMTEDIHGKYFAESKDVNLKYNCYVCHRGHDEPKLSAD